MSKLLSTCSKGKTDGNSWKKNINCSSAPNEPFCRLLCGNFWHPVGNCFPCVRGKNRRNFVFSDNFFLGLSEPQASNLQQICQNFFLGFQQNKIRKELFGQKKRFRTFSDLQHKNFSLIAELFQQSCQNWYAPVQRNVSKTFIFLVKFAN